MTRQPVASRTVDADELATRAMAVLKANQLGWVTRPSPQLYPHQWSWDAAFIAMAYAHVDQSRAEGELRALFAGQWSNGMLPHIVFAPGGGPYFPGPDFWQVERSPYAPAGHPTSGIVQPPVHATAVLQIVRRATDPARATMFLTEMLPKLDAWHGYLHRERNRGNGLVEIWHPWESGMDNSPLWDDALARIVLTPDDLPSYERVDLELAHIEERPTGDEYDRYVYLVALFRELAYEPAAIREASPFAVQDALFNAVLVQADRDLATLAQLAGTDPGPYHRRADWTAAALDELLWDAARALHLSYDVRAQATITTNTAAGFAPLYAGVPSAARAARMVEAVRAASVRPGSRGFVVPSLSPDDPRFLATRYWRGPVWPVINWLLHRGLSRYAYLSEARHVRTALLDLARDSGFYEHYDPMTGRGHGGEQFAWTAALILDLLLDEDGRTPIYPSET
ncbi:MAG: amylo-alpha-1,6-glucosidase [Jiangellaceae bacterium]